MEYAGVIYYPGKRPQTVWGAKGYETGGDGDGDGDHDDDGDDGDDDDDDDDDDESQKWLADARCRKTSEIKSLDIVMLMDVDG